MSFDAIKDQQVPLRFLRNLVHTRRIPNALLFWGPSGVGKGLAAIALAKALLGVNRDDTSEAARITARKIEHGNHPDLLIVGPVKKSRIIDVDTVEAMIEWAWLRPIEAEWRVFIIHEAERMRGPAQNHLLKTLEEPPGKSVFILVTEASQLLLPTIRSRCQRVRFGRLRRETVQEILTRERDIAPAQAEAIAAVAQGQMTRAFDLSDSDMRDTVLDVVRRLSEGTDPMALAEDFAKYVASRKLQIEATLKAASDSTDPTELSKEDRSQMKDEQAALVDAMCRRDIMELLNLFELWYRDVLVYSATGNAGFVLNRDQLALLESAAVSDPGAKIGAVEKARLYLERFLNEERVFRDLFFALAS